MRFLVDTQLPLLLAKILNQRGYDAVHSTHFDQGHLLKDKAISEIVIVQDRIIVTKGNDFRDSFLVKGAPPRVLLLEMGNLKNRRLFDAFREHMSRIEQLFDSGADLVIFSEHRLIAY
jgi:predicted nuclease of predicted toxin-antitoxin system